MPFDAQLLPLLRCPVTSRELRFADADLVARAAAAASSGGLVNRDGTPVTSGFEAGLIDADGEFLYLIHRDIPCLLPGSAIPVAAWGDDAPEAETP